MAERMLNSSTNELLGTVCPEVALCTRDNVRLQSLTAQCFSSLLVRGSHATRRLHICQQGGSSECWVH